MSGLTGVAGLWDRTKNKRRWWRGEYIAFSMHKTTRIDMVDRIEDET